MGKGIELAREADVQSGGGGLHAQVLDDLKDQLIVVFLKRLQAAGQSLDFPVAEIDDTGKDMVSFQLIDNTFRFVLSKKS